MMDSYELTIIISNYNQEMHITETIDSALSQRVSFPFKIIITDDYSCCDRSREIIRDYASRYPIIEPIFGKENKGYLANILRAETKTKTKYFCLLDADDYWTDRDFLQRAYDYLEDQLEYSIYESNVEVMGDRRHSYLTPKFKSGTYSKGMYLKNESIPVTQTTGMVFRNCIFKDGIPDIMSNAVGTRSERSFEGDTGRFIMHLKYGLAYYDSHIVGVYRKTSNGIWSSLSETKKRIITAHFYPDYYQYYGTNIEFFANKAYRSLQRYFEEKRKEIYCFNGHDELIDEYEKLMVNDVYDFCCQHEDKIDKRLGAKDKIKQIYRVLRA